MVKYFHCDLETSGTDKNRHGILQIAGCIEIDNKVEEYFEWFVKLYPDQEIDPDALAVNNIKPEDIETFMDPRVCLSEIKKLCSKYVDFWDKTDKFFFVGYNAKFDYDFFREFFIKGAITEKEKQFGNGFGNYFWVPPLDVMNIAAMAIRHQRGQYNLPNFKLITVAKLFGIVVDDEAEFHNARFDIDVTRKLFKLLIGEQDGTDN